MLPWQWMLVEVTAAGRLSSLLSLPVEVTELVVKTMPVHLDCVSSISPVSLLVHLAIRISDLLVAADPNRPHRLHFLQQRPSPPADTVALHESSQRIAPYSYVYVSVRFLSKLKIEII